MKTQTTTIKAILRAAETSADGLKRPQDNAEFQAPQTEILVVTPVDVVPGKGGTAALDGFMAVFQ